MKTTLAEFLLLGCGLVFLLFINASLVACEAALIKLRYSSPEIAATLEPVRRRRRLDYLIRNADTTAPVIRFGIVAATIGLGGVIFPLLSLGLMQIPLLDVAPGRTVAAILGFVIAVSLIRLLGFTMPRALSLSRPAPTLRWTSWIALAVVVVVQPWFRFLRRLTARLFTALHLPYQLDMNVLDVDVQIRALAGNNLPQTDPYLRGLVTNTIRLGGLEVSDILLPRNQVQCMDASLPLADNLARARSSRHTRFPLCRGTLDNCIGIIHIKDVFLAEAEAKQAATDNADKSAPPTNADKSGNAVTTSDKLVTPPDKFANADVPADNAANSTADVRDTAAGQEPPAPGNTGSNAIDLMQLHRKLIVFRPHTKVEDALQALLRHKVHMALVRDAFGGTLGVITLDSILEEIVGEIVDEFDTPTDAPISRYATNKYRIDGLTPIHDVETALNITIDSEEVSTLGGLVSEYLGRIPEAGERIELPHLGLTLTADTVDERRLITALVEVKQRTEEDDAAAEI